MPEEKQGLIFISCGQFTEAERQLGKDLAAAVTELTDFEGYFAQNQTSLEGLSRNIFDALNHCSGLVAVMHRRGEVDTPTERHTRGSVWVEQEIAIAAFLKQAQNCNLEVAVYIQSGIKREGVRDQLHLNPVEFNSEAEVLTHMRKRLQSGLFSPLRRSRPKEAQLRLDYKTLSFGGGAVHQYQIAVFVRNSGTEPLSEYWVELLFPNAVLEQSTTYAAEVRERRSDSHRLFRHTQKNLRKVIYPEDEVLALTVDYYMNDDIHLHKSGVLNEPVVATFGSPGMATTRLERPFRDFQKF
jgi:hypothetical protein